MGCLEMELQLLTKAEADADPVGAKRKEPNHVSEQGVVDHKVSENDYRIIDSNAFEVRAFRAFL